MENKKVKRPKRKKHVFGRILAFLGLTLLCVVITLCGDLRKEFGREFSIEVSEIRRPEVEAQLVAENIAQQLERRIAFRRAMKRTVAMARKFGGEGIKVSCAGRLAGAEIARGEWYRDGRVPLQTLRADIDYGFAEARTTYGTIGVKVWIYKGEILDREVDQNVSAQKG